MEGVEGLGLVSGGGDLVNSSCVFLVGVGIGNFLVTALAVNFFSDTIPQWVLRPPSATFNFVLSLVKSHEVVEFKVLSTVVGLFSLSEYKWKSFLWSVESSTDGGLAVYRSSIFHSASPFRSNSSEDLRVCDG